MAINLCVVAEAFSSSILDNLPQKTVSQKNLKPITVSAIDKISRHLFRARHHNYYVCMNKMDNDPLRQRVVENMIFLNCDTPQEYLLDIHVYHGEKHPYYTDITCESEGYGQLALQIGNGRDVEIWDLRKLLIVPSPIRIFVTRVSSSNSPALLRATDKLIRAYKKWIGDRDHLIAVQLPLISLERQEAVLAHWKGTRMINQDSFQL